MTENNSNTETNKHLFINLVTMLSITAMQQLGKIINPAAGKAEINLDAAQATIDTLDMLSARTHGNLDNGEARLMKDTLSALKMNFVETREMKFAAGESAGGGNEKQQDTATKEPQAAAAKPESQAQKPEGQGKSSEAKPEKEPPKFHKSYT